jgi:hypothetical protein
MENDKVKPDPEDYILIIPIEDFALFGIHWIIEITNIKSQIPNKSQ